MSSVTMLGSSQMQIDMTGDPIRADGWYGYPDGLHTIAIYLRNFIGRIFIEGTLESNPTECDWFPIKLHEHQKEHYIEYPLEPYNETGYDGGDSGIYSYTFKTNVLYLRARVWRTYFISPALDSEQIELLGQVSKIMLSL